MELFCFQVTNHTKGSFRTCRRHLLYLRTIPAAFFRRADTEPRENVSLWVSTWLLQPHRESHRLSSSNASLGPRCWIRLPKPGQLRVSQAWITQKFRFPSSWTEHIWNGGWKALMVGADLQRHRCLVSSFFPGLRSRFRLLLNSF